MTASLLDQLAEAEATAERLRREIAGAECSIVGHDWKHIGGRNAGCCFECWCSVPVYECRKCKDCDYGENADASEVKRKCRDD